jgi:SM-20-related protein
MPTAEFFTRFGLFVSKEFLDAALCSEIIKSTEGIGWERAGIYNTLAGTHSDQTSGDVVRKTLKIRIPDVMRGAVADRLLSIVPRLEEHFDLKIAGFEEPQLLRYAAGDYFHGHMDSAPASNWDTTYEKRRVSLVVFLNGQSEEPLADCYCGGSLVFAGLIDDPRVRFQGFPLVGEPGLLIAFRSDLFHEVKQVTFGHRYTIVTWCF